MIEIHARGRTTGKTKEIIERMKKDDSFIVVVINRGAFHEYPKELHDRLITLDGLRQLLVYNDLLSVRRGATVDLRTFNRIIIDEGFLINTVGLVALYYHLGKAGYDIEVYGTTPEMEREYKLWSRDNDKRDETEWKTY